MYKPRQYQKNAVDAVMRSFRKKETKMMLHLPTGAGKTVIAALIIEELFKHNKEHKILFLAHRKEIIDQTLSRIRDHLPDAEIEVEQGRRKSGGRGSIVIASVQSIVRRKAAYSKGYFSVIICDECHHSLAPSWLDLIRHFSSEREVLLLGMTATARRTDGRSVETLFGEPVFEIDQGELQELGYLSPIKYHTMKTDLSLDQLALNKGDFQVRSLSKVMNSERVRMLTLQAWQEKGAGKKTIVFCAGVEHARQLADDFNTAGIMAASVDSQTQERDVLLQLFRQGDLEVLTNYGVLTEGFDEPSIECVLLARPTTSPLVYNQCLGRGLRVFPGKETCVVIDIVDRSTYQLQYNAAELTGLPKDWESSGDPFRERRQMAKIRVKTPEAFLAVQKAMSLGEAQKILMELPPETVLAGIDGQSVLRYRQASANDHQKNTESVARDVLSQASVEFTNICLTAAGLEVFFADADMAEEKYSWIKWHLSQATGKKILFSKRRKKKITNQRAILRKVLEKEHKIRDFRFDADSGVVYAFVQGLPKKDISMTQRSFEAVSHAKLNLMIQTSLF